MIKFFVVVGAVLALLSILAGAPWWGLPGWAVGYIAVLYVASWLKR